MHHQVAIYLVAHRSTIQGVPKFRTEIVVIGSSPASVGASVPVTELLRIKDREATMLT